MTLPTEAGASYDRFQPGQLWSLLEMYQLDARAFVAVISTLTEVMVLLRTFEKDHPDQAKTKVGEPIVNSAGASLAELREPFEALQADMSEAQRVRIIDGLNDRQMTLADLRQAIQELGNRVSDELAKRLVVVIDGGYVEHFRGEEPLFGKSVFDAFPEAAADIDEAGKCLALGRGTSCVFHLMRAMEVAVGVLASKIGVETVDTNGDKLRWGVIVSKMKDAIPKLPKEKQVDWTDVHNLAWGVNKATRNPTMHPGIFYTDEQARRAFEAVCNFMQNLAPLVIA